MESLLASRKVQEEPSRLDNLSPEKYGKAAFSSLTYTPSKLADNVLYKQFSNQKKIEEGSSKLRQTQASNSILQDRLSELQQEKQGIQKALSDQISMYKKILKEKEEKNEKRIKTIQQGFNLEIGKIITEKQEEAKYAQAEKELLEGRIVQLEDTVQELKNKLDNVSGDHGSMVSENQKLKLVQQSLTKRLQDAQNAFRKFEQRSNSEIQQLKKKYQDNQLDWQRRLQKQIQAKERELQNMQRLHRNELQKNQNKRVQEALLKNQELKDLAATFEKQTARLNAIIIKKQEQISELARMVDTEKQKAFQMSKSYQNEITNISHEKTRYKEELLKAERNVEKLTVQNKQLEAKLLTQRSMMEQQMNQLKKDLQLNQINLMREIDKNQFTVEDLSKQIAKLRIENQQAAPLVEQNVRLGQELRNMKELLIQSSLEMERCKQEFIRIGKQKDMLAVRLRELGIENETLYRIKNERQEEARGWRESYFTQKANKY